MTSGGFADVDLNLDVDEDVEYVCPACSLVHWIAAPLSVVCDRAGTPRDLRLVPPSLPRLSAAEVEEAFAAIALGLRAGA